MQRVPQAALKHLTWGVAFALLTALGGCDGGVSTPARGNGKPLVVCTTGQVADIVRAIGGDHLEVVALMGPGVDPHLYKATPGDVRQLDRADAVFFNGLHLEGRMAEVLEKLGRKKPAVAVTARLEAEHPDRLRRAADSSAFDPHVWFDVSLWAECVEYAAERIIEFSPEHASDYRQNADAYLAKLRALDEECRRRLAEIPAQQRVLVTAHDAFEYFGQAYDIEVHGLQGISTIDEADLGALNALVRLLVDRKIKAVFVESSVPAKSVRSLIEGCDAAGHRVVVGGELYSDALGAADGPEGTYIGMVQYNVDTIVQALK